MAKFCTQMRTAHVQNIYWVFCLKGSSLPEMTFLNEIPACRPTVAAVTGRSAGWPWPRPVLLIALLLIAQAALRAAGLLHAGPSQ